MGGVVFQIINKSQFVCVTKGIALKALGEAVESSCKYHAAITHLIFLAWQTKGVYFDCVFAQALVVDCIAVFGQIDMLERADDETKVLGKNGVLTAVKRGRLA